MTDATALARVANVAELRHWHELYRDLCDPVWRAIDMAFAEIECVKNDCSYKLACASGGDEEIALLNDELDDLRRKLDRVRDAAA